MKKIVTLLFALIICMPLCACSSSKHDFLCFDLRMSESEIEEAANNNNGNVEEGIWGGTVEITFEDGYAGFTDDEFNLMMFVSEDTELDMIMGFITYLHEDDENKDAEYEKIIKKFEDFYGKSDSQSNDEYEWHDVNTKEGKTMSVTLKKTIRSSSTSISFSISEDK